MASDTANYAHLPSIPLRLLLNGDASRIETAKQLLSAFERDGFLYLTEYDELVPEDLVQDVFAQSARFFERPQEEKDALEWDGPRSNRGYTKLGQEKTSEALDKDRVQDDRLAEGEDLKESFEIGRDNEDGHPNQWPQDGKAETTVFRETMLRMFACCKAVHQTLMAGIAVALGLHESFFDEFTRTGDNTLRLLHYPPVPPGGFEEGRRVRAGAHSDYGTLTLLFQDNAGGLQVERPGQSGWFDVNPRPGAIVVNAGDLMARWSNDRIRSTNHRVVEPPVQRSLAGHPSRRSVAYFCNPDYDQTIEVLPGTCQAGDEKYAAVNSGDYIYQRLAATY